MKISLDYLFKVYKKKYHDKINNCLKDKNVEINFDIEHDCLLLYGSWNLIKIRLVLKPTKFENGTLSFKVRHWCLEPLLPLIMLFNNFLGEDSISVNDNVISTSLYKIKQIPKGFSAIIKRLKFKNIWIEDRYLYIK